jgi:hypothetical protein
MHLTFTLIFIYISGEILYFRCRPLLQSSTVATWPVFNTAMGINSLLLQCPLVTGDFILAVGKHSSHGYVDINVPLAAIFYSSNEPVMSVAHRYTCLIGL